MNDAPVVRDLDPNLLELDDRLQTWGEVDGPTIKKYRALCEEGIAFRDPVEVVAVGNPPKLLVPDGNKRTMAARMAGLPTIPCRVRAGTWEDAVCMAAGANEQHGRPRDEAARARAHRLLFAEVPASLKWSSARIAQVTGCSPKTAKRYLDLFLAERAEAEPDVDRESPDQEADTITYVREINGTPKEVTRKRSPGRLTPEPPPPSPAPVVDIEAQQEREAIDLEASGVDPGDEDESRIASLRLARRLPEASRDILDTDARLYYEADRLLPSLRALFVSAYPQGVKGRPAGPYAIAMSRFLHAPGPDEYVLCGTCEGEGCENCQRAGFHA